MISTALQYFRTVFGAIIPGTLIASMLLIAGCATYKPKYEVQIDPAGWTNADWQTVLDQAVTSDGYVKYDVLKVDKSPAREALFRYVAQLGATSPENKPDLFPMAQNRLAYYINAYNALCMYGIVQRGPMTPTATQPSVSDLTKSTFTIGGKETALADLERDIRAMGDIRVYFALNNMSRSSPPLRKEAYEGQFLNGQLDDQGQRMLSDPRGAMLDGDLVKLNEIFATFYPKEFIAAYQTRTGRKNATLLDALRPYAAVDSPVRHASKFESMPYDWSVNWAK